LFNLPAPYSQEAEEAVIGAILINPNAFLTVAAFLKDDDFFFVRHQYIWQALMRLSERREPADYLTLVQELKDLSHLDEIGGAAFLTQLINATPSSVHAEVYGRIVERASIRRRLMIAADEIKQLATNEEMTIETVTGEAETRLFNVTDRQVKREFISLYEAIGEYSDRVEYLMHNRQESMGVPSGFRDLDELLGGFQKSDLLVFAGRPGTGKTSMLLSLAVNSARIGARVAIFTMEMGQEQITQRIISMETGIGTQQLRLGRLTPQEYSRFVEAAGRVSNFPIFIDDTPAMTPQQMRTKCRRMAHEHGIDLIIVDYMQLMGSGGIYINNRVQEISFISRALKELARELNVPLISAAQLSRAVEQRQDKRPVLSDLRESGCVAGDELVYLPDEGRYVPIRNLMGKTGFRVTSLNTETWKLEPGIVTNTFCTGIQPVFKLTTRLGRSIRVTANHKFLTICGWKRLDELTTEDHIALPRTLPSPSEQTMSDAELALLGHLIGDGCTLPNHAIQYTTVEDDLAELIADLATQVFGDKVRPRIYKEPGRNWYQVFIPPTEHMTYGRRNPVGKWLDELGVFGLRSHEKFVPEKVFQQPKEAIALFLRHLWATDGSLKMKPVTNGYYPNIYYASSSAKLAFGVQTLLLLLGINAHCRQIPQTGKGRDQYHVSVAGKPDIERFISTVKAVGEYKNNDLNNLSIYILDKSSSSKRDYIPHIVWDQYIIPLIETSGLNYKYVRKQADLTGHSLKVIAQKNIGREDLARVSEAMRSRILSDLATSDVYWDAIVSIEPDGTSDVYDLTVDVHHDFISNNIVISNSIEQDADIVMFLYRDSLYNEATEFPNQADIIVAKHRNGPTGTVSLYFEKSITKFMDGAIRRVDLGNM